MDSSSSNKAKVRAIPWTGNTPPSKILVMRFQALGDTVITLPYIQSLKTESPKTELHFLTRKEVSHIPNSIALFKKVITIGGGRNSKIQFLLALLKLPMLMLQNYDAVIDLQNHKISKIIRKLLRPKAWAEFDNYSSLSAGERTRQTIESLFTWKISISTDFKIKNQRNIFQLLKSKGYKENHKLIVLNPAGYCSSRNWPLKNYEEFARLWITKNPMTQFVLLLLPTHKTKANYLKEKLGDHCIDLTGVANQVEAFQTIKMSQLILSEDSGLMHMAWTQGIPTVALFSSSRRDWSAPQEKWSICLDSADLECGPCALEVCKFGDNRCLTRYVPSFVFKRSCQLLSQQS